MNRISQMQIVATDGMTDLQRYDTQLKALILTAEGTLPGSRGYGLNREFLSKKPEEAINLLAMELEEKCLQYIPEITVANVEGTSNPMGQMGLTIYIERRV